MTAIFLFLLSLSPAVAADRFADVTLVRGNPSFKRGQSDESPLRKGGSLLEGDVVSTGDKGFARLHLADGSLITLAGGSSLELKRSADAHVPLLSLRLGKLRARVPKSAANDGEKLIVTTKTAVLGIRSAEFTAIFDDKTGQTSLVTLEGIVTMALLTGGAKPETALEGGTRIAAGRFLNLGREVVAGDFAAAQFADDPTSETPPAAVPEAKGKIRKPEPPSYTGDLPAALLKGLRQSEEAFPPANPPSVPQTFKPKKK